MMLKLNKKYVGFQVVSLVGTPSDYREVYEALTCDVSKVFLTVYDIQKSKPMMVDGLPKEFAFLRDMRNPAFPELICTGTFTHQGRAMSYMATNYFEGETLRTVVDEQPLTLRDAVDVAIQVMKAMKDVTGYTNGGGHYNLCPDTIILTKENDSYKVRLTDFDHLAGPCMGSTPFFTSNLNPCCRAPETYLGRFDAATDVYAMGMLIAYMIKGIYPYWIDEVLKEQEIRDVVMASNNPKLDLPGDLNFIVRRAISKNLRIRFADLESMLLKLKEFVARGGVRAAEKPAPQPEEVERVTKDSDDDEETEEEQEEVSENDMKTPRLKIDSSVKHGEGLKAVAGMDELKQSLLCDFVDVVKHRELAARYNIRPNNILLFGPQGCGKTYISNRLAEECGMEVYSVSPSDLGSIYIHGTQGIICDLFRKAEIKAKKNKAGCLLLVDEIDAHLGKRNMEGREQQADEVAEWLVQLNDCVEKGVFVIGMTNRLDCIDKAAIRHGRFDKVFYVGLPDFDCRKALLKMEVGKLPHEKRIDYDSLAMMSEGLAAVDLTYAVKEAARLTFCACLETHRSNLVVKESLLRKTIEATHPSVSDVEMRNYERIWDEYVNKNKNRRQTLGYLAQKTMSL